MSETEPFDQREMASRTLAYLRRLDKKLDGVNETLVRDHERLGRVERDVREMKTDPERDMRELKSDFATLENKVPTVQHELPMLAARDGEDIIAVLDSGGGMLGID